MRLISKGRSAWEILDGEVRSEDGADEGCADQTNLSNLASLDSAVGGLGDTDGAGLSSLRQAGA